MIVEAVCGFNWNEYCNINFAANQRAMNGSRDYGRMGEYPEQLWKVRLQVKEDKL